MATATAVEKYLSTYALLPGGCPDLDSQWRHILVVPCYDESASFIEDFCRAHRTTSILLLLVINRPEGSPSPVNQRLRDGLAGWPHQAIAPGIRYISRVGAWAYWASTWSIWKEKHRGIKVSGGRAALAAILRWH